MAEPLHYDAGDVVDLSGEFRNAAGALADPTTVTFRLKDPAGSIATYVYGVDGQLVRVSVGLFKVSLTLTTVGRYTYRFEGTGAVADTEETAFIVDPSEFTATYGNLLSARALCGIADVREFTKLASNASDYMIARLINAASTTIHRVSGRREFKVVGTNPQTRVFEPPLGYYDAWGESYYYLPVGDLTTLTSASIGGTAVAAASMTALPRSREEWEPFTQVRLAASVPLTSTSTVSVTGAWGFPSVPPDIVQACILTVFSWLQRDLTQFSETFVDNEVIPVMRRELPREAYDTVISYKRTSPIFSLQVGMATTPRSTLPLA